MPLEPGSSPKVVSKNIREFHTGKTYAYTASKFGKERANKQAIAVALSEARKSRAFGGGMSWLGGATGFSSPQSGNTPITQVPASAGSGVAGSTFSPMRPSLPQPGQPAPITTSPGFVGQSAPATSPPGFGGISSDIQSWLHSNPQLSQNPFINNLFGLYNRYLGPNQSNPMSRPTSMFRPYKEGGRATGGFNMAAAPHVGMSGPAALPARSMMRAMTRGALLTGTPGRADAHRTFVPSGSYVIPADVVSGRGQGNTLNGAGVLQHMFGMAGPYGASGSGPYGEKGGPYGAGMPKMGMATKGFKSMMPKPPKIQTSILAASGGGKEGADQSLGTPVPVNLSGGEVVVPPENLVSTFRRVFPGRNYTLKQIHAMMDQWVLDERKRHRKTLAKLPGPAKD